MFAVVRIKGKQYKAVEGRQITVDKIEIEEGKPYLDGEVLLVSDGDKLEVGTPVLEKAKVEFEVVAQARTKKIMVVKFWEHVRRRKGHRQQVTKLLTKKISL